MGREYTTGGNRQYTEVGVRNIGSPIGLGMLAHFQWLSLWMIRVAVVHCVRVRAAIACDSSFYRLCFQHPLLMYGFVQQHETIVSNTRERRQCTV